jgi:hypothetical protein
MSLFPMPRLARALAARTPIAITRGVEVCPPSLRQAPDSLWQRALFWLLAPAPQDAAPPTSRLRQVRDDFQACVVDLSVPESGELWDRIGRTHSLRDLWHLRADVYRVVALQHTQHEAEARLQRLNRHFPTRSPRSAFAPL